MAAAEGENGRANKEQQVTPSTQNGAAGTVNGSAAAADDNPSLSAGQKRGREGEAADSAAADKPRWPGWPGENVFRMVVHVQKVGSIIGRKGEFIKKMCEDTKSRIRVLDGKPDTVDRVVMVNAKEDLSASISPAMDGILSVHKRLIGIADSDGESVNPSVATTGIIVSRMLAPQVQASNIIGKQGSTIKSIQETTGASVRVQPSDELSFCAISDDRIIEIKGEPLKVHRALELIVGHLRKYLVDRSVLPLFEQTNQSANGTQQPTTAPMAWSNAGAVPLSSTTQQSLGNNLTSSYKSDMVYPSRDPQQETQSHHRGLSLYGKDPGPVGLRSSLAPPAPIPVITQIIQQMQIPLSYADDVIGSDGRNISYIRRISGATVTVQETRGAPGDITVEIKGTESQAQTAQQLIQNFMSGAHKKTASSHDTGYASYSQNPSSFYSSSSSLSNLPSISGYRSSYGSYGY